MTTRTPQSSGKLKRKLSDSTNKQNSNKQQDDLLKSSQKGNKKVKVDVNNSDIKKSPAMRRSQRACVVSSGGYKDTNSNKEFKENDMVVQIKKQEIVESEMKALENTKSDVVRRRLFNFSVVDEQGQCQPVYRFDLRKDNEEQWFIQGSVGYGEQCNLNGKDENYEKTFEVADKFGPIEQWKVDFTKSPPEVVLQTKLAEYSCNKPSIQYRKEFSLLKEQIEIASAVYQMLNSKSGGSLDMSLDQATAKIARTKVWKNKYPTPNEALLSNANFLLGQLKHMSPSLGRLEELQQCSLFKELEREVKNPSSNRNQQTTGGIVIRERHENGAIQEEKNVDVQSDANMMADEEYARRLQAEMDAMENRKGNRGTVSKEAYIQVSMEEIADDYPVPQFYKASFEEIDELMLVDEEVCLMHREDLPRCILDDFVIYNAEGLYTTLELLPLMQGVDPDLDIFASGQVMEDDSEWTAGRMLGVHSNFQQEGGESTNAGSSGVINMPESGVIEPSGGGGGMRVYLSQIREWVVEYTSDMMFISVCTTGSWYKLCRPQNTYKAWFDVVVKCARIAVKIMKLIDAQVRASRLSFNDVLKLLTEQNENELTYISKKIDVVRRYVVVHSQLILNQFKYFPKKTVQNSAFVNTLKQQMEMMRHSKLYQSKLKPVKQIPVKQENKNPMKQREKSKSNKPRPMAATATALVRSIWVDYFLVDGESAAKPENDSPPQLVEEEEEEEEDEEREDENNDINDVQMQPVQTQQLNKPIHRTLVLGKEVTFKDRCKEDKEFYNTVLFGDQKICVGDVVELQDGSIAMLQCVNGAKKVAQFRKLLKGCDTMLNDAASEYELFMTTDLFQRQLSSVKALLGVVRIARKECHRHRDENQAQDQARKQEQTVSYVLRSIYLPHKGMFQSIPEDLNLGQQISAGVSTDEFGRAIGDTFCFQGVQYRIGDAVLLLPGSFGEALKKKEKDSIPNPYNVAQILDFKHKSKIVDSIKIQHYWRPYQIDTDTSYASGLWEVYRTEKISSVSVDNIANKCQIVAEPGQQGYVEGEYKFLCTKSIDTSSKKVKSLAKSQEETKAEKTPYHTGSVADGIALATMDIFAGCGGLTEGMHQARAANTKWAIEYEAPAAEAYRKNHPHVTVFNSNCNVILQAAMQKAGKEQECVASDEAKKESEKLSDEFRGSIPVPGEVQFITGGPPCQGFSGMNRFNTKTWSVMQNSMVMAFLSYVDFYRPRYFLLENVKNFIHHNDSRTMRLTVRTLLDIGYQVRVGLLNAGLFGVPQSRRRTFILAALPGDTLPDWPAPLHVFKTQNLTISFKDGHKFHPVPPDMYAPLRSITVRDAIADLPRIQNGDTVVEKEYEQDAVSEYQKYMRGECNVLQDHICKTLDELNYERCKYIPHDPKYDWRALQEVVKKDPSKEKFKGKPLVPWCLPNTAARHNNWQGLFGRLDMNGFFPTSTTDPNPMGKVGRVFHPNQERIVSVRECARAQGFPDHFTFHGTIQNKHRQVGNAVPPPLAKAIGMQLRKVLDQKEQQEALTLMRAQL